jgi:hypothetical protein
MKSPTSIFKESIQHFKQHASVYLGYSAWILVPTLGALLLEVAPENDVLMMFALTIIILGIILYIWVSVICTLLAVDLEKKEKSDLKKLQVRAFKQIVPLLLVGILQTLIFLGGFLLLIIPLFFFVVWYSLAQTAVMIDNKRGVEALSYSRKLTRGRYWYTAWGMIGLPAIVGIAVAIFMALLLILFTGSTGQEITSLLTAENEPVWFSVVDAISQMFLIPIMMIYTARFYQHMKHTHADTSLANGCEIV